MAIHTLQPSDQNTALAVKLDDSSDTCERVEEKMESRGRRALHVQDVSDRTTVHQASYPR